MRRTLCVFVLSLMLTTTASAQSFSDVPHGSWFYVDVESLVGVGIVDGSMENYRPEDNVNRAEMSKLIVEAFEIAIQSPDFETFTDVARAEWYFDFVETVAMNGIAIGYLDANGDLNNLFGPNDPITREQAAKMIVLGAELSINTGCGAIFSDVAPERWSYDYITTLYANSVIDGYGDGTFGPESNINRAEIARIINQSRNPVLRDCADEVSTDIPVDGEETATTGLRCIGVQTSENETVVAGANNVEFLNIECEVTADTEAVTVDAITFTRSGVADESDIENLYLYEGDIRLTSGKIVNASSQTVEFRNLEIEIEPEQSRTLTLVGTISPDAPPATQHAFSVANETDIESSAPSVHGIFPITGLEVTVAGQ